MSSCWQSGKIEKAFVSVFYLHRINLNLDSVGAGVNLGVSESDVKMEDNEIR